MAPSNSLTWKQTENPAQQKMCVCEPNPTEPLYIQRNEEFDKNENDLLTPYSEALWGGGLGYLFLSGYYSPTRGE